jgi:hypothetical protein
MEDTILEEGMQDLGHVGKEKMLSDWILVERALLAAESGKSTMQIIPVSKKSKMAVGVSLQLNLKFGKKGLKHGELKPEDVPLAEHKEKVFIDWRAGYNSILVAETGEFKITHDKIEGDEEEAVVGMTVELEVKFHDSGVNVDTLYEEDAARALKIAKKLYNKYDIS